MLGIVPFSLTLSPSLRLYVEEEGSIVEHLSTAITLVSFQQLDDFTKAEKGTFQVVCVSIG